MKTKNGYVCLHGLQEGFITKATAKKLKGLYRPTNAEFKAAGTKTIDVFIPSLGQKVTYHKS